MYGGMSDSAARASWEAGQRRTKEIKMTATISEADTFPPEASFSSQ